MTPSAYYFGSFQHYSRLVLETLIKALNITLVVTTPTLPDTAENSDTVLDFAIRHHLPYLTPSTLAPIPPQLRASPRPDFLIVAGYGKLLPPEILALPTTAPLNLHPSLLPHYRGRFPAEWAILRGEKETGVSLIHMSDKFDQGKLYAQLTLPILPGDTKDSLYTKLFTLGAHLLLDSIHPILEGKLTPSPQAPTPHPSFYARKLERQDGYIPLQFLTSAIAGTATTLSSSPPHLNEIPNSPSPATLVDRMTRALNPYPGVWTTNSRGKRIKILKTTLTTPTLRLDLVQLEGKTPTSFNKNLL